MKLCTLFVRILKKKLFNLRSKNSKTSSNNGGEITKNNVMGKRQFAYEINKFRDGIYVLVHFNADPSGCY